MMTMARVGPAIGVLVFEALQIGARLIDCRLISQGTNCFTTIPQPFFLLGILSHLASL